MKQWIFSAALLAMIATGSYGQTSVTTGVMRGKDYGVTYALPKTQLEIEVVVNHVKYTPGELCKYADRYLRIGNLSADAEEYWELKEVTAKALPTADSKRVYFVKLKDKTVAPLMELTEDGFVKSINMPISNKQKAHGTETKKAENKKLDPRSFLTEEILMTSSTAKMAELIAQEIYSIRESKNALLRGQADNNPTDGEQMKLMLENLNLQEQALMELFIGVKEKTEKKFTIRINPEKEIKKQVAFRFSRSLGVLDYENLAGEPVYVSLTNLNSVEIPPLSEAEKKDAAKGKVKELEGVAYNVPGKALVTIKKNRETLFEKEIQVVQFGTTEYLSASLFNKKGTIRVLFNPETGGLIKMEREEQ